MALHAGGRAVLVEHHHNSEFGGVVAATLPDAAQEAAAAAISIASNGSMPGWLGELYLRLGKAVVVHLHAFFVRGQTIIRAHLLHPSPHRRTVS